MSYGHIALLHFTVCLLRILRNNFYRFGAGRLVWIARILATTIQDPPLRGNNFIQRVFTTGRLDASVGLNEVFRKLLLRVLVWIRVLNKPNLIRVRNPICTARSHACFLVLFRAFRVLLSKSRGGRLLGLRLLVLKTSNLVGLKVIAGNTIVIHRKA